MEFTEKDKKRWLPEVDKPGTFDEHIDNLGLENEDEDFGSVMTYDPALAKKY
ncbi:MAG: hypothetical protein FWF80_05090 [Defluviitaleaceae bacterium]|nr:hypothetical protein [Defluviitaleaceae bacterium]